MIQQIVANSLVLKTFSKIDIFKKDLGDNLTGAVSMKGKDRSNIQIKIKDDFIQRYRTNTKHIIFKYGSIGTLNFYQDTNLENNEFLVFDDNEIYEIEIDSIHDFQNNPRKYLSDIIGRIENKNEQSGFSFTTVPESVDIPDQTLPKEQYINKMVERRKKLSGNG